MKDVIITSINSRGEKKSYFIQHQQEEVMKNLPKTKKKEPTKCDH